MTSVAMGVIDGRPVVVSGREGEHGGSVLLWDARTGKPRGEPLDHRGVSSVAMGVIDGEPVVVSGGGGAVRLWDARTGKLRGESLDHGGSSVAMGVIDGEPVVVSGGYVTVQGTTKTRFRRRTSLERIGCVCLWDARTGTLRGDPLVHGDSVRSVAMGVIDGQPVVVSGATKLRPPLSLLSSADDIRVWDARTGQLRGKPLRSFFRQLPSDVVAIGVIDGDPVIVAGGTEVHDVD